MIAHYAWVAAGAGVVALAVGLITGTMMAIETFDRGASKR